MLGQQRRPRLQPPSSGSQSSPAPLGPAVAQARAGTPTASTTAAKGGATASLMRSLDGAEQSRLTSIIAKGENLPLFELTPDRGLNISRLAELIVCERASTSHEEEQPYESFCAIPGLLDGIPEFDKFRDEVLSPFYDAVETRIAALIGEWPLRFPATGKKLAARPTDQATLDVISARIRRNRAEVPASPLKTVGPNPERLVTGGMKIEVLDLPEKDPQRTDYLVWLSTAVPSQATGPNARNWEVFKHLMNWEGLPPDIQGFDRATITLGAGFTPAAQLAGTLLEAALGANADLLQAFLFAGVTVDHGKLVVLDLDAGVVLSGPPAELLFRKSKELMSLYFQAALGNVPAKPVAGVNARRQAFLDANFATFLSAPSAVPSSFPAWHTYPLALAAHAIHFSPAAFSWRSFSTMPESSVEAHIRSRLGAQAGNVIRPALSWPKGKGAY